MKNSLIAAVVALVVAGAVAFFFAPVASSPVVGASSGNDHYNLESFFGGVSNGTQIATTSQGTAITIAANEFKGWANAATVSYIPIAVATTAFTLPASTTLAGFLPKAGDTQTFCVRNATTTANVQLSFTGGTGTNLLVASSSVSAVGSAKLTSGKVGCFRLVREAYTTSSFDIDALFTAYQ